MRTEETMRKLIRVLVQKGADEDFIEAIVRVLETDENFLKMIEALSGIDSPSKTCMLGKAILIAEP